MESYISIYKARRWALWHPEPPPPPPPATPDESWSKTAIIDWLLDAGIEISVKAQRTLSKAELLVMVGSVLSEEES